MQDYWDYYVDGAECAPAPSEPDYIEESRLRLREIGCSPDQIQRLTESGFLAMKDFNILIDRHHGHCEWRLKCGSSRSVSPSLDCIG